jgi:ribosome-binding factor A
MREERIRVRRVSELIQAELGRMLIREFQDASTGIVTVTRVEMTPDLLSAKVYVAVYGAEDPSAVVAALEKSRGHIRKALASRVRLKYNPELFFLLDPGPEYEERIDRLIDEAKKHGA